MRPPTASPAADSPAVHRPPLDDGILKTISEILGDTDDGLTGWQIAEMLHACGIKDPGEITKRIRIYEALTRQQGADAGANTVCAFIEQAMHPARYIKRREWFFATRDTLNQALAFAGLTLGADGKLTDTQPAETLPMPDAALTDARAILAALNIHPDVIKSCERELLAEDYFHAVLEAVKSVGEKIRRKTGFDDDGTRLIQKAFQIRPAVLNINQMKTPSEIDEHKGFSNLLKGLYLMFRNPLAHEPRASWIISKEDAIGILLFLSLIHRRIDSARIDSGIDDADISEPNAPDA